MGIWQNIKYKVTNSSFQWKQEQVNWNCWRNILLEKYSGENIKLSVDTSANINDTQIKDLSWKVIGVKYTYLNIYFIFSEKVYKVHTHIKADGCKQAYK